MNVPSTLAAPGGEKVRRRLPELATEALMVVFAVLVALGVAGTNGGLPRRGSARIGYASSTRA